MTRHLVYLGVGSNIRPEYHIAAGLDELDTHFRLRQVSTVYRSEAVGFDGDPFLNLVACIESGRSLPSLAAMLKRIEFKYGREPNCGKFSPRTLDIDILTFDRLLGTHSGIELPRPEATVNAYVLEPFAEIAPSLVLPGHARSLTEVRAEYGGVTQPIEPVAFAWRGCSLPLDIGPGILAKPRSINL